MLRTRKSWKSTFESAARGRRSDTSVLPQPEAEVPPALSLPESSLYVRMENRWYRDSAAWDRPKRATDEDLESFEQRHNAKLPADLRQYFRCLNGVDMDSGMFRFWPLSKIIPLKSTGIIPTDHYFLFADYMVGTWYYAIYLGEDTFLKNRVILPDFPNQPAIAPNFSEFIELYLTDSPKLYGNV
jgi:hypothetical protein